MLNLEQLQMLEREIALGEKEDAYGAQAEAGFDVLDEEIETHLEEGFYVPTREELMDTAGDFFAHLLTGRQ